MIQLDDKNAYKSICIFPNVSHFVRWHPVEKTKPIFQNMSYHYTYLVNLYLILHETYTSLL